VLREGLASPLDRLGLEVLGTAGDAAGLIELTRRERPDLAVVDIRMPPEFDRGPGGIGCRRRGACRRPALVQN